MKVRHLLIFILSGFILFLLIGAFIVGKKIGTNYGVEHAEEIKALKRKKKEDSAKTEESSSVKYVSALMAKNEVVPVELTGYGKVNASSMVNIASEVQGILQSHILLKKGVRFSKGQLLFTIKNADAKIALESKKGNFLSLLTSILPDIKIDYSNVFDKWSKFFNSIELNKPLPPLPEFSSPKEKSFIVSRNVVSQYYSIKSDEERLKKYSVIAPFNGSIIEATADDGSTVAPGMSIIKVLRDGKLEIEIPILAQNMNLIKKGLPVILKNSDNDTIEGKIARIGKYVNPVTQTIPAFVNIEKSTKPIYNGMYLESKILCNSTQEGVLLPRTAIFEKNKIFIVDKNNVLRKKTVKIVLRQDKTVLVQGLKNGELVVYEAIVNAKEGDKVALLK